mmetsp:Transcript_34650/g.59410  ORF Transcript_34650/g.59410 Transcript_34650/m.59410 type:complete len:246 (+) Transcript_34650:233-970(+)
MAPIPSRQPFAQSLRGHRRRQSPRRTGSSSSRRTVIGRRARLTQITPAWLRVASSSSRTQCRMRKSSSRVRREARCRRKTRVAPAGSAICRPAQRLPTHSKHTVSASRTQSTSPPQRAATRRSGSALAPAVLLAAIREVQARGQRLARLSPPRSLSRAPTVASGPSRDSPPPPRRRCTWPNPRSGPTARHPKTLRPTPTRTDARTRLSCRTSTTTAARARRAQRTATMPTRSLRALLMATIRRRP